MHIEVICSNCNHILYRMKILRAVRDIVKNSKRCPNCNALLSSDFSISAEKV